MKSKQEYQKLLDSLSAGSVKIDVKGLTVEVRNCHDRVPGKPDPRTAFASHLTREVFRNSWASLDPELQKNEEHLFGPEYPKSLSKLEILRRQFGWCSTSRELPVSVAVHQMDSFSVYEYASDRRDGLCPCVIFFHGGGFFGGDIATVENQCRLLADLLSGTVFSVDYPLAPEHKYPAGFNACFATVKWVYENSAALGIDRHRIGVAGDSAGGNLSLACSLKDRFEGTEMISYQCLIYPTVSREESVEHARFWHPEDYDDPYADPLIQQQIRLIGSMGDDLANWYLTGSESPNDPFLSPIVADPHGLPKTLIVTAEYDFLRAECEAYSRILTQAGVPNRHIRYGGLFHGTFDRIGYAPQVEDILREIAADMKA